MGLLGVRKVNKVVKKILLTVFISFLTVSAFAQSGTPKFENYTVKTIYNGTNAKPKLDKDTYQFRTRIRYAAKQKRNFSGEFVLTAWGCGASCLIAVAINVRTGAVYDVPFTICCWQNGEDVKAIDFRLNSRLIIFSGVRNESEKDSSDDMHYYEFRNGNFRFLKTIKRG